MVPWSRVRLCTLGVLLGLNQRLLSISAAVYAARYVSDRFLPDKAIDLVDEAASSLRLAQESKPDALEQLDRAAMTMQIELTSLRNESDPLSAERRVALEQALERTRKEAAALEEQWQAGTSCLVLPPEHSTDIQAERERLQRNKERKRRLEEAKHKLEVAQRRGDYEAASRLRYATIPELEREIPKEGICPGAMLGERVTSDDIARVVARATGIPVQSLLKGERERLIHVCVSCLACLSLLKGGAMSAVDADNMLVGRWRPHCGLASSGKTTSSARSVTLCAYRGPGCRRPRDPWRRSCSWAQRG